MRMYERHQRGNANRMETGIRSKADAHRLCVSAHAQKGGSKRLVLPSSTLVIAAAHAQRGNAGCVGGAAMSSRVKRERERERELRASPRGSARGKREADGDSRGGAARERDRGRARREPEPDRARLKREAESERDRARRERAGERERAEGPPRIKREREAEADSDPEPEVTGGRGGPGRGRGGEVGRLGSAADACPCPAVRYGRFDPEDRRSRHCPYLDTINRCGAGPHVHRVLGRVHMCACVATLACTCV